MSLQKQFERRILVPPGMKDLHDFLGQALKDVKQDAGWQETTKV